jgi:hypothetical protein
MTTPRSFALLPVVLLLLSACAPAATSGQSLQVSVPRSAACTKTSTGTPINGMNISQSFGGSFGNRLENALEKVGFRTDWNMVDRAQIRIFGTVDAWENLNGETFGRVGRVDLTIADTRTGLPLLTVKRPAAHVVFQASTVERFTEEVMQVLLAKFCQQVWVQKQRPSIYRTQFVLRCQFRFCHPVPLPV